MAINDNAIHLYGYQYLWVDEMEKRQ